MIDKEVDEQRVRALETRLSTYYEMNTPIIPVLVVSIVLLVLFYAALSAIEAFRGSSLLLFSQDTIHRSVLVFYICGFSAIWVVYFLSRYKIIFFQVRTLRNLLLATSDNWSHADAQDGEDSFTESTRRKATSLMMMLAMLTASSTLLLIQTLNRLEVIEIDNLWLQTVLYGSAGAAIVAFVCFIISVDSLDSTFNRFSPGPGHARRHMIHYFYTSTRTTRYLGVMFILAAVVLYTSSFSSLFGAFVSGVIITTGWTHWFPNPPQIVSVDTDKPDTQGRPGSMLLQLLQRTLWRAPILLLPLVIGALC